MNIMDYRPLTDEQLAVFKVWRRSNSGFFVIERERRWGKTSLLHRMVRYRGSQLAGHNSQILVLLLNGDSGNTWRQTFSVLSNISSSFVSVTGGLRCFIYENCHLFIDEIDSFMISEEDRHLINNNRWASVTATKTKD